MSLAETKRRKNLISVNEKGYPPDPEGLPLKYLLSRLDDEVKELKESAVGWYVFDYSIVGEKQQQSITGECADVSNIIDYIHAKILNRIADKYKGENDQ